MFYKYTLSYYAAGTSVGQGKVRCTISFVDKLGELRKFSAKGRTYKGAKTAAAKAALREMDRQRAVE